MGIDIHEWRRFHGKSDPNPAAYRSGPPAHPTRFQEWGSQKKTAWRKAKAKDRQAFKMRRADAKTTSMG